MTERTAVYGMRAVENMIITVRGQKVILDADLAAAYDVPTKALNQAVKRNKERFPEEFAFPLTAEEVRSNRSQIVTGSARHRDPRYPPMAFTEHGAIMAATVLNSQQAVQMSVFIVRAFVRMRQAMLGRYEMEKRLDQIEKILLVHDDALKDVYEKIRPLLLPPAEPEKPPIGFKVRERSARYAPALR